MRDEQSLDEQFLSRVLKIIDEHLEREDFSVEKLAQLASLSRSMLHRKLTRLNGHSASELILRKRLTLARNLLENNTATVAEIAYRVGFSSPAYFNRVFKKHFKVSPGGLKKGSVPGAEPFSELQEKKKRKTKSIIFTRPLGYSLLAIVVLLLCLLGMLYFSPLVKTIDQSIAVLPFTCLNSEIENQYFADGMADDLLSKLSRIDGLEVISSTSSEFYRERGQKTIPQIAKELGVDYILEGTVQREQNRSRINVQLIDAAKDKHVWSNQYDREITELFHTQSEIALKIASELNAVLTRQQISGIKRNSTNSRKAFELYQLGRIYGSQRNLEGYNKSIEYYNKAIDIDHNYGLAYAGLADIYHLMALQRYSNPKEGIVRARELALKALELDPKLAEPHAILGSLNAYIDHYWEKAEEELLTAIELNPNYSTAYHYYSEVLLIRGKAPEARMYINKALELDPFSFVIRYLSAYYYYLEGKYEKALAENRICLDLIHNHLWAMKNKIEIYYKLGMHDEALDSFKKYITAHGHYSFSLAETVIKKEGLDGLIRLEIRFTTDPYDLTRWNLLIGDYEKSLDIVENLWEEKHMVPLMLLQWGFDTIKDQPRYRKLMNAVELQPH